MKRVTTGLVGLGLAAAVGLAYATPGAAQPSPGVDSRDEAVKGGDAFPQPLETKRQALRETAITSVINGDAKPVTKNGTSVVKVGQGYSPADAAVLANKEATAKQRQAAQDAKTKDQYVELEQERSDKIFVILAEFGNERHPDFPDKDTDPSVPGPTTFEGPLRNQIPEPDRTKDNSTVWQSDYNRGHYQDLYFAEGSKTESVKTYYEEQSSGRYTVDGTVSDWVKVPYNEARYGRDESSKTTWNLIQDAITAWVADQKAAGKTDAEIKEAIASYDEYDRYDFDGDGNFNESDGYIDHFQIVHAGGDEADGDPQQGEDAIWSHRWYAFVTDQGLTGPGFNKLGGTQVGDTGIWVGDYTVQPENGGLSVFAHEYGHDLGLPDDYDTSGGGDNNSEYWTLMAQSRLNAKDEPLGTRPGDLGAWNKLQLGWFDYEAVAAGAKKTLDLGPQEYNSDKPQGAVVVLPKKNITVDNGAPASGEKQFWSGMGDDLSNSMTTDLALTGKSDATLTAKVRYSIEEGFDNAYLQTSDDGGETWTALDGTLDGQPLPKDASGTPTFSGEHPQWGNLEVPLTSVAGKDVKLRALYRTDGGLAEQGLFLDDIKVVADGATVLEDGAEAEGSWDVRRLQRRRRHDREGLRQLLPRRSPLVRQLRQVPEDRSVQLRLRQHQARLGGALQVRPRPAGLVLGHVPGRQQHQRAPGRRPQHDHRRQPVAGHQHRDRCTVAIADPDVRRAVLAAHGGLDDVAHQRQAQPHPWAGRQADVQRHEEVLVRGAAQPRREAAGCGSEDPGAHGGGHLDAGQVQLTQDPPRDEGRASGGARPSSRVCEA